MPEAPVSPQLLTANQAYYDLRSEEAHIWHALRWAQSSAESRGLIEETKRISLRVKAAMDERLRVIGGEEKRATFGASSWN